MDTRPVLLGVMLGEHLAAELRSERLKIIGLDAPGGIPRVTLRSGLLLMWAMTHHGEFDVLVRPEHLPGLPAVSLQLVVGALSGAVPYPWDEASQLMGLAEHLDEIERWARSAEAWTELLAAAEEAGRSYPRRSASR